jgi:hypothetical protein
MDQIWRLLMFTSMCGFAFISGAPTTNYPVDNYLSFEGEREFSSSISPIYGILFLFDDQMVVA